LYNQQMQFLEKRNKRISEYIDNASNW
jgi:hypothetical protein